jgi:ABC-type spermidine/putrescine transport system permease subunit I
MMMSNLIDFYTRTILNWNVASAIAVILFFTSASLLLVLSRVRGKEKLA